jgi:glycosyltransferase involved in cell wall biosynthesis
MAILGRRPSPPAGAPAPTAGGHDERLRRARVSVIVGGALDARRRQVARGERPRIDVLEMESRFGARVYDFDRLYDAGLTVRLLRFLAGKSGLWSFCLALYCLRRVKDDDVVYATGEDVGYPLAFLLRLFRLRRPRLLVRLEQPTYGRTAIRRALYNLFLNAALKRVHLTITRNTAHIHYLSSNLRVPLDALTYVPEPTDPSFFDPVAAAPAGRRGNGASAHPVIISAGLERRDYPTLIEAMRGVPARLIIGAGSPWSHARFSAAEDLPDNVTVSSFSPAQLRDLYRAARFVVVSVQPSLQDCGMNVILEAWAMGKGVIVSRTVGLLDSVHDGEDALFVPPADPQALRSRILHLLQHPDEADRLGRSGRARVQSELNLDRFLDRIGDRLAAALD